MKAPLIWHIEKYLRATGMSASLFGRESAKDPKLVFDLRNGRTPGERLSRRVSHFMERRGINPVPPRQAAAQPQPRRKRRMFIAPEKLARANVERELRLALIALVGGDVELSAYRERPWASATFVGGRHYWTLTLSGPNHADRAAKLEAIIGEHEFSIRGHIVADAIVTSRRAIANANGESAAMVTLEILTIEED